MAIAARRDCSARWQRTAEGDAVQRLGRPVALEQRPKVLALDLDFGRRAVRQIVEGVHLMRVGEWADLRASGRRQAGAAQRQRCRTGSAERKSQNKALGTQQQL